MFESLYDSLPLYLRVVLALLDYCLKAAGNWRDTPEGAKEWSDFTDLYEQSINQDAGSDAKPEPAENALATTQEKKTSAQARARRNPEPLPDNFDYSSRGS